jgi:adenylosuccinate lyase
LWVALAEVESEYELVAPAQVAELKDKQNEINLSRSFEIEGKIHHDLMAELQNFSEQCPGARGIIHLGATSMDIKDNASILQQKEALELVREKLRSLLIVFADKIKDGADIPLMAITHLQLAEPSTLGYRLAQTAQDLLRIYQELDLFINQIQSKGFTGAVGTSASFAALIGDEELPAFHEKLEKKLGLSFFDVTTQTYSRLQDFQLLSLLSGLGAVLYKFAFDIRILQSPGFLEVAEPFGDDQIGSSAMPFKKNPIRSEKIDSLGRYLAQLPRTAWDNAAHSLLERTLDDSANRRIIIPEAFLCVDEMITSASAVIEGLVINQRRMEKNVEDHAPFAATEALLMALAKAGADRQVMHGLIREHSLIAWKEVREGKTNPLKERLSSDEELLKYMTEGEMVAYFSLESYLGDCRIRANAMANKIRQEIGL